MKVVIKDKDYELLEQLARLGTATVPQLCKALRVTATAVRQRLDRLQNAGLIDLEAQRQPGRGRPKHLYRLTRAGLRELGENYGELIQLLWSELSRDENGELRKEVLERLRDALVRRYGSSVHGETVQVKLEQLAEALRQRGFRVEVDLEGSGLVLREECCPYPDLVGIDSTICELHRQVFERVLGNGIRLYRKMDEETGRCEFWVASEVAKAACEQEGE